MKLSRPQKRRRRADRQAIRAALVNTSNLKQELSLLNFDVVDVEGAQSPTSPTQMLHQQMYSLDSKLDQIIGLLACGAWYGSDMQHSPNQYLSPTEQTSIVLQCLDPAAPVFTPKKDIDTLGDDAKHLIDSGKADFPEVCAGPATTDLDEQLQNVDSRVRSLEEQLEDIQAELQSHATPESEISFKDLESHIDLEITRVRAQVEHDYSRCMTSITALEEKVARLSSGSDSQPGLKHTTNEKIDLNSHPAHFNAMQKGLVKQLGAMLNSLVDGRRSKQLQELRRNLASQKGGATKQQQGEVLDFLESTFKT